MARPTNRLMGQFKRARTESATSYGEFEFTLGRKQTSPLWVLAVAKVEVGDSRGTLVVYAYAEQPDEDTAATK
ncbi:MAG: hypothetical protein ABI114_06400 [Rhodanobacter sp.]